MKLDNRAMAVTIMIALLVATLIYAIELLVINLKTELGFSESLAAALGLLLLVLFTAIFVYKYGYFLPKNY